VSQSQELLQIRGLSKTFPGLKALDDVSLSLRAGEIVGLVGQNGSGKSTLVKILAGVHQPDAGSEVVLSTGQAGEQAELHFIHQDLGLVEGLSTIENLDLDHRLGRRSLLPSPTRAEARRARELITSFGASFDPRRPVGELGAAERTIVAIARALDGWSHQRNVLVLDEPTASLHGDEAEKLFVAVRSVAARGAGVIFISHRLDEIVDLADRVVALRDGRLIADVARGQFDHDDLVRMIAGAISPSENVAAPPLVAGRPVLRARGIAGATIRPLDLDLHAGEVLGVSGVLGSGREQIAAILYGASEGTVDSLEVGGKPVSQRNPRSSIAAGVAYLPSDRRRQGAVMTMRARENITLPRLAPLRRRSGRLDGEAERAEAQRWIDKVAVRPPDAERALELFSGGNQQKVLLAKWLRNEPQVLLMDEPTQGVDVGAKTGIFELIATAAASGAGVLICSSDAKELALICDRVIVLSDGVMVADVKRPQLSEAELVRAALGSRHMGSANTGGGDGHVQQFDAVGTSHRE
jgi:ABC-type sugar transport system ATPase subunit